jgi:exodeoxyribonuclease V alpha subunit
VEALAGTIDRVAFHSPETGFCVLKVQARGKRDLVPVIGHAPAIGAGEWITATGVWINDRQHGLQFKADTLKATPPTGAEGIEKYLASGHMRRQRIGASSNLTVKQQCAFRCGSPSTA